MVTASPHGLLSRLPVPKLCMAAKPAKLREVRSVSYTHLDVYKRQLQDWEQGRAKPSGAAKTLLKIAEQNPEALMAVAWLGTQWVMFSITTNANP